jgi:hypothetical protein
VKLVSSQCWFLDDSHKSVENLVIESEGAKIAVLCGHSPEYAPLAKHTIYENKREYCQRHEYDLHVILSIRHKYIDPHSHASGFSWSRMEEMLDLVTGGKYEWVWCVGADTLITNMTIALMKSCRAETSKRQNAVPAAPVRDTLPPPESLGTRHQITRLSERSIYLLR